MDEEKLIAAVDRLWPVTAPRWLDAPTCEGWWWKNSGDGWQVVRVVREHFHGEHEPELVAYVTGDDMWVTVTTSDGSWFGPLVPPSVVSGATSSGA